jgi:hypothetical protein
MPQACFADNVLPTSSRPPKLVIAGIWVFHRAPPRSICPGTSVVSASLHLVGAIAGNDGKSMVRGYLRYGSPAGA